MMIWQSKKPSDLTTLAQRNGGALLVQPVWEMIDGRPQVPLGSFAHGSRDMPVWGDTYRAAARLSGDPTVANNPEWFVRGRIVALINHLQRIQVKLGLTRSTRCVARSDIRRAPQDGQNPPRRLQTTPPACRGRIRRGASSGSPAPGGRTRGWHRTCP